MVLTIRSVTVYDEMGFKGLITAYNSSLILQVTNMGNVDVVSELQTSPDINNAAALTVHFSSAFLRRDISRDC